LSSRSRGRQNDSDTLQADNFVYGWVVRGSRSKNTVVMINFFVPFRAWAGCHAKRQILLTAANYCNIVTGVKSPENAIFEHTNTR
jgi:hypothetical protein